MALEFWQVYLLSNSNFVESQMMVLGCRPVVVEGKDGIEFLTTGETSHAILGDVQEGEDGTHKITDLIRVGDDGQAVMWTFEKLTLENWKAFGETGGINGFRKLASQISDIGTLVNFYQTNFLYDWWTEDGGEE